MKKFLSLIILLLLSVNFSFAVDANILNSNKPESDNIAMSNKEIVTAGLTKDMSVKQKKKKFAKFCDKNDLHYIKAHIEEIDWTNVESDFPDEFYELVSNEALYNVFLNPKYITDEKELRKIINFVELLQKNGYKDNPGEIIGGIDWENVPEEGCSNLFVTFVENHWLYYIPDAKYFFDNDALTKLKNFIETNNIEKIRESYILTNKNVGEAIIKGTLSEKFVYAFDKNYLKYQKEYQNEAFIKACDNDELLNKYIFYIEKMKAENYSDKEITEFFKFVVDVIQKSVDSEKYLAPFIEKNYVKDFIYDESLVDAIRDGYSIEAQWAPKFDFVFKMYEKGYKRNTISEYEPSYDNDKRKYIFVLPQNSNVAVEVIDTMLKNGYTVDDTKICLKGISGTDISVIPDEFYSAVRKHLIINTLDKDALLYVINASEDTASAINLLAKLGIQYNEITKETFIFIENKENAKELIKAANNKPVDGDILIKVLNSNEVKDSKKLKTAAKIQAVRNHNEKHKEHMEFAGNLTAFSCFAPILIVVTWPAALIYAVPSAIADKVRKIYYIPRYIQAKKLGIEI